MKWDSNSVQNIYSKTFYYKNDPNSKAILFLSLEINIHLINTLSNLLTFCFIKLINFDAKIKSIFYFIKLTAKLFNQKVFIKPKNILLNY